jgi:hypothetical protein
MNLLYHRGTMFLMNEQMIKSQSFVHAVIYVKRRGPPYLSLPEGDRDAVTLSSRSVFDDCTEQVSDCKLS